MKRLVTALAGVGLMLVLTPPAVSSAASNTATTLMPLPDGTQLETHARARLPSANGSCDFIVGADRKSGDGVDRVPARPVVAAKHRRSAQQTARPIWTCTPPPSTTG